MRDTNPCNHHQLIGQREFCPDCGLSRTEVLVESCAPFLKDDETPAECIRRNRKDVEGCMTMLVAERREKGALRAERDELLETQRKFGSMMHEQMDKLDEAVALLTEIAGHRASVQFFAPHLAGVVAVLARLDAFLARTDSQNPAKGADMTQTVDSTSDARTINNVMRHGYRVLSDEEKAHMQAIKDKGLELWSLIGSIGEGRELSLAKTKTEEAVMWAVKHITR